MRKYVKEEMVSELRPFIFCYRQAVQCVCVLPSLLCHLLSLGLKSSLSTPTTDSFEEPLGEKGEI